MLALLHKFKYIGHIIRFCCLEVISDTTHGTNSLQHKLTNFTIFMFLLAFVPFTYGSFPTSKISQRHWTKSCTERSAKLDRTYGKRVESIGRSKRKAGISLLVVLKKGVEDMKLSSEGDDQRSKCLLRWARADWKMKVQWYEAWSLTAAKNIYDKTHNLCLAVIWAVLLLRMYMEGAQSRTRTDQDALR